MALRISRYFPAQYPNFLTLCLAFSFVFELYSLLFSIIYTRNNNIEHNVISYQNTYVCAHILEYTYTRELVKFRKFKRNDVNSLYDLVTSLHLISLSHNFLYI